MPCCYSTTEGEPELYPSKGSTTACTLTLGQNYHSTPPNQSAPLQFLRRHSTSARTVKLMKGKNDPTTFFPLNANIGGKAKSLQIHERNLLTEDQARLIYKKVESGNIISINILQQEIDQDQKLNRLIIQAEISIPTEN